MGADVSKWMFVGTILNLLNMKKTQFWMVAALLLMSFALQAQPPRGGRPEGRPGRGERFQMPEVLADTVFAETRTAQMTEKYQLSEQQKASVYALNLEYASKLQFDPSVMGDMNQGERKDPRSMSDAERQEFFRQMQERMGRMQDAMAEIEDNQKAYDLAIKELFTKEQYKQYKKDRRKEDNERQVRMQGGFGGPRGGGFGGPGGGFGGPGGGFGGPGGGF